MAHELNIGLESPSRLRLREINAVLFHLDGISSGTVSPNCVEFTREQYYPGTVQFQTR